MSDLNNDGLLDVAVTNTTTGTVSVLAGSSAAPGTLLPATVCVSQIVGPVGISVGDVDGDNIIDIVVADYAAKEGNTLHLMTQATSASQVSKVSSAIYNSGGAGSHDIVLCDLNGDGYLDVATSNFGNSTVGILLNSGKH